VELRQTRIQGSDQPHQLAKVRTKRNQTVVIDLGPAPTEGLQLEKGDALFATGSIGRLGGKPVLFADRVAELARIERPDQPSVSSGPPSGDAEPGDAAARQSASSQR
jgi:hypothetical protein